jgi:hypothetical protein
VELLSTFQQSGNITFVTFGEIIVRQVVGAGEIVEEVGDLGNVFS